MASRAGLTGKARFDAKARRTPMPETDLAAFYQQVYLPLVRRATWRHHLPAEDARDIVQDAFVLAIERIDACGNPKAWLIQVVDHLCLNHSRKALRRLKLSAKWSNDGRRTIGAQENPE
jgi:DNA-directed RNA polymerase specialized sigma24 family protein